VRYIFFAMMVCNRRHSAPCCPPLPFRLSLCVSFKLFGWYDLIEPVMRLSHRYREGYIDALVHAVSPSQKKKKKKNWPEGTYVHTYPGFDIFCWRGRNLFSVYRYRSVSLSPSPPQVCLFAFLWVQSNAFFFRVLLPSHFFLSQRGVSWQARSSEGATPEMHLANRFHGTVWYFFLRTVIGTA
jgi:hypothetical protein